MRPAPLNGGGPKPSLPRAWPLPPLTRRPSRPSSAPRPHPMRRLIGGERVPLALPAGRAADTRPRRPSACDHDSDPAAQPGPRRLVGTWAMAQPGSRAASRQQQRASASSPRRVRISPGWAVLNDTRRAATGSLGRRAAYARPQTRRDGTRGRSNTHIHGFGSTASPRRPGGWDQTPCTRLGSPPAPPTSWVTVGVGSPLHDLGHRRRHQPKV